MALRYLNIFCKVYEYRSFSHAASSLYLTQPTVSSHIKSLEDDLDIKLFDRLGREIVPTKAGTLLYSYAKEVERLKRDAIQALTQFSGQLKGRLDIGGSNIPGEYLLPAIIGRFKEKCSEGRVNLFIGDTREIVDMIINGKIELGIVGANVDDDRIEMTPYVSDELVLIAPLSYKDDKITGRDLVTIPLILRERGSGSRKVFEREIEKSGLKSADLNIVSEMGSTEAVKRAVKAGVGLSVVSSKAIEDELICGSLKVVQMEDLSIVRSLCIISHRLKNKSPLCQAFLDFLMNRP